MTAEIGGSSTKRTGRPPLATTVAGLHRCTICKELKPLTEFHKDRCRSTGHGFRCRPCNRIYKRKYHETYNVRARPGLSERRKAAYQADRENRTAAHRELRARNGHKWEAKRRAKHVADPVHNMLSIAKTRAKRRGIEFSIERSDIVIPQLCPIFRVPLKVGASKVNRYSPSLDRIDNSKGYVPGNVVVVSFRANTIKSDATIAELRRIVEFYEALR